MDLNTEVMNFIRSQRLIKPGTTLVLGVSGGADSTALARLMHGLRHELSLFLYIAHFNHRLRPTAGRDQKFVKELGRELNVPVVCGRREGKAVKAMSEEQSRHLRLKFFAGVMRRCKADALVLAHTQNDAAETVLMRLLRGSGLQGLRGILPKREIEGMTVVRPLLGTSRAQIEAYLSTQKADFCTDESNARPDFLRNKIRLELLPLLAKRYNPQIVPALAELAQTAADDYDFLQKALITRIKENVVSFKGTVRIRIAFYGRQHAAMQRLLLRHAFERLSGGLEEMTFSHIAQAQRLIHRPEGSVVHWPRSIKAARQKNHLVFYV